VTQPQKTQAMIISEHEKKTISNVGNTYRKCNMAIIDSNKELVDIIEDAGLPNANETTIKDQMNKSHLGVEAKVAYLELTQKLLSCRNDVLDELSNIHYSYKEVIQNHHRRLDNLSIQLLEDKVTIGEYVTKRKELRDGVSSDLAVADEARNKALQQDHEDEVAASQRAYQQRIQRIEQASRQYDRDARRRAEVQKSFAESFKPRTPVLTNCNMVAGSLNCTSY